MKKAEKHEQLAALLKRLNAGEDPAKVKREAKEFLASVNPADLSFAEQKLIAAGIKPEDLRQLCVVHMEMAGEDLKKFKASLPTGHVIHTLVSEHERILAFLDALEKINESVKKMKSFDAKKKEFGFLLHIAEHLVEAEPHHKREEDVLFPSLEKHGVYGPPSVMRLEHEDIRPAKHKLLELAENAGKMNFAEFKKKLDEITSFLAPTLRDHIFKENNILYPTAVDVITDKKEWETMKKLCDKIGYCCFTPKT